MKVDTKKQKSEKEHVIKDEKLAVTFAVIGAVSFVLALILILAGWIIMRAAPDLQTALITVITRPHFSGSVFRTLEFAGFTVMRTGPLIHGSQLYGTIGLFVFLLPLLVSFIVIWIIDSIKYNRQNKDRGK